jgi:hypothetical protein
VAMSEEKSAKVVQFSCSNPVLLHRLAEDVKRSSFASRPKYITALLEALLSFDTAAIKSSCLDDLIGLMRLFKSLPLARIRRLATSQNRNFEQMFRHLIDVALSYYSEEVSRVDDPRVLSQSGLQPTNGHVD